MTKMREALQGLAESCMTVDRHDMRDGYIKLGRLASQLNKNANLISSVPRWVYSKRFKLSSTCFKESAINGVVHRPRAFKSRL